MSLVKLLAWLRDNEGAGANCWTGIELIPPALRFHLNEAEERGLVDVSVGWGAMLGQRGHDMLAAEEATADGIDLSAYVPVKELWPQRSEFKRASDVTKFLDKLPNGPAPAGIRNSRKGQRRFVHAGDWHRYFAEKDRKASEALGAEELQVTLAGIAMRQAQERERKQGK